VSLAWLAGYVLVFAVALKGYRGDERRKFD
jgi:hypothetical protein